jgi:hypothetical protein
MSSFQRSAPRAGYRAEIGGDGGPSDSIDLDFDTDIDAVKAAFGTSSPFGHTLGRGRRFIGYFDAGERRLEALYPEFHVDVPATSSPRRLRPKARG